MCNRNQIIKCNRCGADMKGQEFDMHECLGMRYLPSLPLQLLREVATGQMTETEAFAKFDAERKG